jgi:Protein of unknown function (DUF1488)
MDGSWDQDSGTMKFIVDTILCGVSREALEDLARTKTPLDRAALQGVFRQHQSEIRQKAAQKISAGEIRENGTVLIRTADLNP